MASGERTSGLPQACCNVSLGFQDDLRLLALQKSIEEKNEQHHKIQQAVSTMMDTVLLPLKDRIIDATIDPLVVNRKRLECQFNSFVDQLSGLHSEAQTLKSEISSVEVVKTALEDSMRIASASRDLRRCEAEMRGALAADDLPKAARHLVQARTLIDSGCLDENMDTAVVESVRGLERQLVKTVGRNFKEGILQQDHQLVSKYAKLFYPLNLHKEGTSCYLNFLRESLSNRCASNFKILVKDGMSLRIKTGEPIYAQVLTKVFEGVVQFIEEHQQNVETEFGLDTYLLFLRGLEKEADIQAVRVFDKFQDDHQQFLEATTSTLSLEHLKEADLALEELALMSFRCQQFTHFLHRAGEAAVSHFQSDTTKLNDEDEEAYSTTHGLAVLSAMTRRLQELMGSYVSLENVYVSISVQKALAEADITVDDNDRLISTLPDDTFFILRKAIIRSIASCDDFAVCAIVNLLSGLLSSLVRSFLDNALQLAARFYSEWAASQFGPTATITGPEEFRTALLALAASPKEEDLIPELSAVLKWTTKQPVINTKDVRCSVRLSWPHLLNDLATCMDYVDSLVATSEAEFMDCQARRQDTVTEQGTGKQLMFQQSLLGLGTTKKEFQSSLQFFSNMLVDTMLQPVLVPLFRDFAAVPSTIDQATFADFQVNDPFMSQFTTKINQLISHFRTYYTHTCFATTMDALISHITAKFEECILKKEFTLLGAVQLETDIRALLSNLTQAFDRPLLSKFARLMEMVEVLCVASVEELQQLLDPLSMGKAWKLSLKEIQNTMQRRIDLPISELETVFAELSYTTDL